MVSYKALNTLSEATRSQTCDGIRNGDGCQTAATIEAIVSQTCDGIRNGDGYQTAATIEATPAQTCDGIGNGDRCQTAAVLEAKVSQTCDGIYNTINGYFFGNNHFPRISPTGHCGCLICSIQIVGNAIYYYGIPPNGMEAKEQSEE